jgi:hypothetical protein
VYAELGGSRPLQNEFVSALFVLIVVSGGAFHMGADPLFRTLYSVGLGDEWW